MEEDRLTGALERIAGVMERQEVRQVAEREALPVFVVSQNIVHLTGQWLEKEAERAASEHGGFPPSFDVVRVERSFECARSTDALVDLLRRALERLRKLAKGNRADDASFVQAEDLSEALTGCCARIREACAESPVRLDERFGAPYHARQMTDARRADIDAHLDELFDTVGEMFVEFRRVVEISGLYAAFATDPSYDRPGSSLDWGAISHAGDDALARYGADDEGGIHRVVAWLNHVKATPFLGPLDDPVPHVSAFWLGFFELVAAVDDLRPISREDVLKYVRDQEQLLGAALSRVRPGLTLEQAEALIKRIEGYVSVSY